MNGPAVTGAYHPSEYVSADIVRNERDLEARMGVKGGPNACTSGKRLLCSALLCSALIDFEGPLS